MLNSIGLGNELWSQDRTKRHVTILWSHEHFNSMPKSSMKYDRYKLVFMDYGMKYESMAMVA